MNRLGELGLCLAMCAPASAQTTTRVSVDSAGMQGNGGCGTPSITPDGRYVAFLSFASNLVPGDTNMREDVFVNDRQTGATIRVSVSSSGAEGNGLIYEELSISGDGRYVAFASSSNNLVPGDTNGLDDVFVHDLQTGATTLESVSTGGAQVFAGCYRPSISSDGRYVAFVETLGNHWHVYLRDRQTGITSPIDVSSAGTQCTGFSNAPSISGDGRYVAFMSECSLAPGNPGHRQIYVHDTLAGITERVSVDSSGVPGNDDSDVPSISSDGRHVAFSSRASNLVPGITSAAGGVVYVHDRQTGITKCASVSSSGVPPAGTTYGYPSVSADGRYVAFHSGAPNLVPGDTNSYEDIFVHDCLTGVTSRESVDYLGNEAYQGYTSWPSISADGRFVAFTSGFSTLVPGDTNNAFDVFVRDRGPASAFASLCFGDGSIHACPCANSGSPRHGCENSASTGGALLTATGSANLSSDTVQLTASGENAHATSLLFQGNIFVAPVVLADGLRCTGGALRRMYRKSATGGMLTVPQPGDPSVSMRSAFLGDPVPLGATRIYQMYYRDPVLAFCPGGANLTNAIAIAWGP